MAIINPFPHYANFTQYTPTLPSLYWDVYSSEQRIKALCMEYVKLVGFTDSMVDTLNAQYALIEDMQARFPDLVNDDVVAEIRRLADAGEFDDILQAAADAFLAEKTQQIEANTAAIAANTESIEALEMGLHNVEVGYIKSYETVTAMKQDVKIHEGMVVRTNGFHEPGDDGYAFYTVSTTGTANDKDVIQVQNGLVAILQYAPEMRVEQFGVHGDGVTDDTDSFEYAVNKAILGSFKLKCMNSYNLGEMSFNGNEKSLQIEFGEASAVTLPNAVTDSILLNNFEKVEIIGGMFNRSGELSSLNQHKSLMHFTNTDEVKFTNVSVTKCLSGSAFLFTDNVGTVTARGCNLDNCSLGGFVCWNAGKVGMDIANCNFSNFYAKGTDIWYSYPVGITYQDYDQTHDIAEFLTVRDCSFYNCQWEAVDSHGAKQVVYERLNIHNCARFIMAYMDGRVKSTKYGSNVAIRDCTMRNDSTFTFPDYNNQVGFGVQVYGQLGRMVDNLEMVGNIIENPATLSYQTACNYFACIKNMTMRGNLFKNALDTVSSNYHYAANFGNIWNGEIEGNTFEGFNRSTGVILNGMSICNYVRNTMRSINDTGYPVNCYKAFAVRGSGNMAGNRATLFAGISRNGNLQQCNELVLGDFLKPLGYPSSGYYGYKPIGQQIQNLVTLAFSADGSRNIEASANSEVGEYGIDLLPGMNVKLTNVATQAVTTNLIADIDFDYGHKSGIGQTGIEYYQKAKLKMRNAVPAGTYTITPDDPVTAFSYPTA